MRCPSSGNVKRRPQSSGSVTPAAAASKACNIGANKAAVGDLSIRGRRPQTAPVAARRAKTPRTVFKGRDLRDDAVKCTTAAAAAVARFYLCLTSRCLPLQYEEQNLQD